MSEHKLNHNTHISRPFGLQITNYPSRNHFPASASFSGSTPSFGPAFHASSSVGRTHNLPAITITSVEDSTTVFFAGSYKSSTSALEDVFAATTLLEALVAEFDTPPATPHVGPLRTGFLADADWGSCSPLRAARENSIGQHSSWLEERLCDLSVLNDTPSFHGSTPTSSPDNRFVGSETDSSPLESTSTAIGSEDVVVVSNSSSHPIVAHHFPHGVSLHGSYSGDGLTRYPSAPKVLVDCSTAFDCRYPPTLPSPRHSKEKSKRGLLTGVRAKLARVKTSATTSAGVPTDASPLPPLLTRSKEKIKPGLFTRARSKLSTKLAHVETPPSTSTGTTFAEDDATTSSFKRFLISTGISKMFSTKETRSKRDY